MSLMLAATFALLFGAGAPLADQALRYRGLLTDGSGAGRVEYRGASYRVREGDEIPGFGTVAAVTARALVVRRALTEAEKQAREAQGLFAADVQEVRVPVATGSVVGVTRPAPRTR